MKKTVFLLLLSPAGGGKTTLIRNSVPVLAEQGHRVAIVFNDDGDPDAVDMPSEIRRFADLETMTAGCFGCDDADSLVATLRRLDGQVDIVFVEPIGFTAAGEMLNVFGRAGITPWVVTLVDAEHLDANLRIGTLGGQVAAADIVLITKANEGNVGAAHAYARRHRSIDARVLDHGVDQPYCYGFDRVDQPFLRVSIVKLPGRGLLRPSVPHHCDHDHHGGASCGHDHQDHVHIVPRHIRLCSEMSIDDLRQHLNGRGAIRAKGKVGDIRFSMVHGIWNTEEGDRDQPNFVTYYTVTKDEADQVARELGDFALGYRYASRGTADEVRDHADGGDLLLETVEKCETALITLVNGHPVSNPEWQELLNELRKRQGVTEEDQARAVRARVRHLLNCGDWYIEHSSMDESAPWNTLHGIAVGIAWFCSEQPGRVGEELIARARRMPIVRWLAMALIKRPKTNSDLGREEVMADEAGITARWGRENAVIREGDLLRLSASREHCLMLAERDGRDTVIDHWRAAARFE